MRYRGRPRAIHLFHRSLIISLIAIYAVVISRSLVVLESFLALILVSVAWDYLRLISIELAVTNKRVVIKTGFFQKEIIEILSDKIEGIRVEQDLIHRWLGSGNVIIIGVGGTRERLENVEHPSEFRRQIQTHVEDYRNQTIATLPLNK